MNSSMQNVQSIRARHSERGAILVVSLLLLLVLTIIGVSSMQGTALEENMAYANRDRNIALQSAESALREAENWIQNIVSPAALTGSNGLYRRADTEPYYKSSATWTTTGAGGMTVTATHPTGSAMSQYIIKETGLITGVQGAMNLTGYGENKGSGDVTTFRITSRGQGAANNNTAAEVLLRSNYGREF